MACIITPQQQFISKAEERHGKLYDYSKTLYVKRTEKVIIICSIHGEFTQNAGSHLSGCGCRKCGIEQTMNKRTLSVDDFIEKAKQIHNNKYSYDKINYSKRNDHIIIICPVHGEFTQLPKSHLKGYGCRMCANELISKSKRKLHDTFIQEAIEQHGNTYDYSSVSYIDCYTKIIIICKKHGEFQQSPSDHLSGRGCVNCGIERRSEIRRKQDDEFIEKAIEYHGNTYDYSKINYVDLNTKIIIICKKHGEFQQSPSDHLSGRGCVNCGIERRSEIRRKQDDEFIEKAIEYHGNTYDYSKINYVDLNTKIIIICKKHGEFQQSPSKHILGQGCKKCGDETTANKLRSTTDEFIKKANITHNCKYDYSKIQYLRNSIKVTIICPIHGPYLQTPSDHLSGNGCNKCSYRISTPSKEWLSIIHCTYPNMIGEYRIPNTRYHADGYDPETNTIYEFHGDYWHGNPMIYNPTIYNSTTKCTMGNLYEKTQEKKIRCLELGYKYVEIWESTWNRFKKFIRMVQLRFRKRKSNPI